MFKINSETYVQILTDLPNTDMILSGWHWEAKWFLGILPYIVYTKPLIK